MSPLSQSLLVYFRSSAGCKPCTWGISHTSHSLSTFLRIRADPSMLIFWISVTVALSDTLDVFYHFLLYCTRGTNDHRDHFSFHLPHRSVFLTLDLCTCFSFLFLSGQSPLLSDGVVISISLQVEFTESLMMMSGLFAVIVLSVLTGMPHMMVICFLYCTSQSLAWSAHTTCLICNLDLMILTDVPVEIRCSFIVPGDVLCFG